MLKLFFLLRVWWTLLFWRPTQTSFGTLSRSANPSGEILLPFWRNWEINIPRQGSSCCPTVPLHSASGHNVFIKTGNKWRETYSFVFFTTFAQVIASCVLLVERFTCRKKDYALCHKYNAAIGCMTIVIIIVNILATAFGGPDNDCKPVV